MEKTSVHQACVWAAVLLTMLAAGCATQRIVLNENSYSEDRLFVTRAGSQVTLAWDSRPDIAYTVRYSQSRGPKSAWRILPGFDRIRGTGRRITYNDTVPENETRYYRLYAYPAVSMRN